MMRPEDDAVSPRKRRRITPPQAAPYILRELLAELPLATEDTDEDAYITCVEYWNDNLYIGTSAAEVLHFVCLPPDPSDESSESSFILASRLPIFYSQNSAASTGQHGVQQIVLLPSVNKACILCNGTLTFYLLPELSPAFGNTKVSNCRWIGGVDLNRAQDEVEPPAIMVALQNRIMLVKIGDDARRVRNIEFPRCMVAARRGTIACAADTHAYSLLEVEHQQKIPLFPISSSNETFESGHVEEMPTALPVPSKTSPPSPAPNSPSVEGQTHSQSLGAQSALQDRSNSVTPEPPQTSGSPRLPDSQEQGGNSQDVPPDAQSNIADKKPLPPLPKPPSTRLKPHVVSASLNEFLLVTGTAEKEPGVGMFVNMDGDMERSTINFDRYPESIAIDGRYEDEPIQSDDDGKEERIIAVIGTGEDGQSSKRLEVQRLDIDPGEAENQKRWVEIPLPEGSKPVQVGLSHTVSPSQLELSEMGGLLRMVRLKTPSLSPHIPATDPRTQASIEQLQKEKELFESQELTDSEGSRKGDATSERDWEAERNAEEARFARGLGRGRSSLVMWAGNRIWRIVRNPLTVQLDDVLQRAQEAGEGRHRVLNRDTITDVIQAAQEIEPVSEGDFLGLSYVKQKASLMLFGDLVFMDRASRSDTVIRATEKALVEGNLDPRMVLILIPLLRGEVLQGPQGIWIQAGLAATTEKYIGQSEETENDSAKTGATDSGVLDMVKRFLLSWQQKMGYGSITDETYVFDSVDAALLHLLLEQDSVLTAEQRASSPIRTELNRLVDNWKGNFDRAVALLENYHRLFILSRLYQSQKMSRNVLKTWRRIIDGEQDLGGEVTPSGAELQMRRYLVKIKDAQLVEEYGSWLAGRNPKLGVQVFADGTSRVRLESADVVELLKQQAPNAVQAYLEHLVFFKNYSQYADDLVSYYLDTVLSVLQSSPEARESLSESYSTYRALRPPKPTYMSFITANIPSEPWWQIRLRLLQLLGGGSSTQFSSMSPTPSSLSYSIPAVLARIEPFQNDLVSESIILDGLQGRHREALRLLTHGLGDYDSAVRYCLFGGPRSTSSTGALTEFAERPLQTELFRHLLDEFLRIEDPTDRLERTTDLLARFSSWFDVREVLELVPDDWSVEIMSGFLGRVFRAMVSQTREAKIERALSAGLNLRVSTEYIEGMEKGGGWIEDDQGLRRIRGDDEGNERQPPGGQMDGSDFGDMVDAGTNDNDNVLA